MDKPECCICDNTFDSNDHRPRVLPCGHGFCSKCIETAIHQGDKTCAVCRKEHGASSCNDLPFCFLLEDFAHKLSVSASQKHVSESVHGSNHGMCPKHKEFPLFFKCKSHNSKVCHSCIEIDHPSTSCQLITIEDEMQEIKNSQMEAFRNQRKMLINTEKDLNNLLENNKNELVMLLNKIEKINLENIQIENAIEDCTQKQNSFLEMEKKLCAATSSQNITIQCDMGKTEVLQSQEWKEKLKKEFNVEQLYAQVERYGVLRSCRVFEENGKVFIPCMSKEVKPPSSARLMKEAELGLTYSTTTIFMDISERGQSQGRVIIRVFSHTYHGQYFVNLVLGDDGFSLKGTKFRKYNVHRINMQDYMTEKGSKRELENISVNYNETRVSSKGKLFPDGNSIALWFNNQASRKGPSPFGNVVSGLDLITTLHASSKFGVTEITITDCGIVLKS